MQYLATLLTIGLATALHAAEPMSAAEFDAYTTGKTLFYGQSGAPYGAEIYMKNRRVRWSFLDGECKEGHWYAEGEEICFLYEDRSDPQCWVFYLEPGGLIAEFRGEQSQPELYEARDIGEEMLCLGPRIGV